MNFVSFFQSLSFHYTDEKVVPFNFSYLLKQIFFEEGLVYVSYYHLIINQSLTSFTNGQQLCVLSAWAEGQCGPSTRPLTVAP